MNTAILLLALASATAQIELPSGTLLTYRGNFVAEKGDAAASEKRFSLTFLVGNAGADSQVLYWTLEEQGRGGWSWLGRFGGFPTDGGEDAPRPTLLYERAEGNSVIPLLTPWLARDEALAAGQKWTENKFDYEVQGLEKFGEQECWRVEVRNAYGLKRSMLVAQPSGLVATLAENVFIGQGEKHELHYELASREQLSPDAAKTASAAFESFLSFRNQLGLASDAREVQWNDERLAKLRAAIPALVQQSSGGPLAKIALAAEQDAKEQKNRAGAVAVMREKLIGNAAPQPALQDLAGAPFDWNGIKGKVTVLHFWEYRDTPLEEPYGQVAYLDFLFRNRKSEDVQVFGVSADPRLQDPETRGRGVVAAKKLRSFMNLSYPILADHQDGAREFGDPRVTGAKLPLFVVIGRDGKITHYHVGTYEVNRDRGLEELEQAVSAALENRG